MSSHDFDGSFLKSLSIDDTNYLDSQTRYETCIDNDDNDDDDMEIDNTLDLGPPPTMMFHTPPPEHGNLDKLTPISRFLEFFTSPFQSTPLPKDQSEKIAGIKDYVKGDEQSENSSISNDQDNTDNIDYDKENHSQENKIDITAQNDDSRKDSIVSSFSHSILSPTVLGAKLAIVPKQKLLLPPNMDYNESVDYEIDTNSNSEGYGTNYDTFGNYRSTPELKHRTGQRNMSSFSSSDANVFFANKTNENNEIEEYTYNPVNGGYESNTSNNPMNNSINQSYMYRKQMNMFSPGNTSWATPVQVHHHHYYSTPLNQSSGQVIANSEGQQGDLGQLQMQHSTAIQMLQSTHPYSIAQTRDINLPLPWEANSSPLGKTSYVLSSYLQLIVNFIATCYAAFLVYSVVQTVRQDIKHKLSQQTSNLLVEIESCRRSYNENNCSPELIVPILEKPCAYWLKCMNQDPYNGGGNKSLISAETVGMIINSLIEPLSFKFFLVLFGFVFLIFVCNFTFGFIRAKSYYGWDQPKNNLAEVHSLAADSHTGT